MFRKRKYRTGSGSQLEHLSMNSKSTTETLNDLLQVLEDGKEGFSRTAEAVKDPNLKAVFSNFANERAKDAAHTTS
jgi:hypothetical protein